MLSVHLIPSLLIERAVVSCYVSTRALTAVCACYLHKRQFTKIVYVSGCDMIYSLFLCDFFILGK